MKIIMDLDDTLFIRTKKTKEYFKLSQKYYELAIINEKINKKMFKLFNDADEKIILTGRNGKFFRDITLAQLDESHVDWQTLLLCPKDTLVLDWKKNIVKGLKKQGWKWIDNDTDYRRK